MELLCQSIPLPANHIIYVIPKFILGMGYESTWYIIVCKNTCLNTVLENITPHACCCSEIY